MNCDCATAQGLTCSVLLVADTDIVCIIETTKCEMLLKVQWQMWPVKGVSTKPLFFFLIGDLFDYMGFHCER